MMHEPWGQVLQQHIHRLIPYNLKPHQGARGLKRKKYVVARPDPKVFGKGQNSYAQNLADELGADVKAPDQYMWYYPDGRTVPMGMTADGKMDKSQPGKIHTFKPRKSNEA